MNPVHFVDAKISKHKIPVIINDYKII